MAHTGGGGVAEGKLDAGKNEDNRCIMSSRKVLWNCNSHLTGLSLQTEIEPTTRADKAFSFFELPAELRNRVYSILCMQEDQVRVQHERCY